MSTLRATGPGMRRSRIAIGGVALGAALAAGWLLLSPPRGVDGDSRSQRASASDAPAAGVLLPEASGDKRPVTTLADAAATELPPAEPASAPAAAAGPPELSGEPLTIRGQVVDASGKPIEGAT